MKKVFFVLFIVIFVIYFSLPLFAEEYQAQENISGFLAHHEKLPISVDCPSGCTIAWLYDGENMTSICFQKYYPPIFFVENEGKEVNIIYQYIEKDGLNGLVVLAVEYLD